MRRILLAGLILWGGVTFARAADQQQHCMALDHAKALPAFKGATYAELTPGQFHFAQGLYVANPTTPKGMPPGDKAILVTNAGDHLLLFIRGPLACYPMQLPNEVAALLDQIKTGKLSPDGDEL